MGMVSWVCGILNIEHRGLNSHGMILTTVLEGCASVWSMGYSQTHFGRDPQNDAWPILNHTFEVISSERLGWLPWKSMGTWWNTEDGDFFFSKLRSSGNPRQYHRTWRKVMSFLGKFSSFQNCLGSNSHQFTVRFLRSTEQFGLCYLEIAKPELPRSSDTFGDIASNMSSNRFGI